MTPLVRCPTLGAQFRHGGSVGQGRIAAADRQLQEPRPGDGRDHGPAVRLTRLAIPTAGNAGGALAAYAARAGMEAFVFMPDDTPAINQYECHLAGAKTFLVPG